MSNKKITPVNGYTVDGKFTTKQPVVCPATQYEFKGVLYPTLEAAEEANRTLTNSFVISRIILNLMDNRYNIDPGVLASRILTTPNGVALYNAMKNYFEPLTDKHD